MKTGKGEREREENGREMIIKLGLPISSQILQLKIAIGIIHLVWKRKC